MARGGGAIQASASSECGVWGRVDTYIDTEGEGRGDFQEKANVGRYEQALVCLFNREIVDASRRRTFLCKMANNRFF